MQLVIGSTYESSRGFGRLLYLGETHDIDGYLPTFRTTKGDLKFYGYDQLTSALVEFAPPTVSRADELIACLEGEIAKRDARIAELEGALSWHEEQRSDMAELRAELAAIKAQGVVMPERMSLGAATRLGQRFEVRESFCAGANYMHGEFARLNAAPVQQVSVPDGWRLIKSDPPAVGQCVVLAGPQGSDAPGRYWRLTGIRRDDGYYDANGCGCDDATHWHTLLDSPGTLAAAPAAPAADAGVTGHD